MTDPVFEYECALSGIVAPAGAPFEGDDLEDIPEDWTEVRLSRRVFNPRWVGIQTVKRRMTGGLLSQLPEEQRQGQLPLIALQVEAQFHGLESETPRYLTYVETVYISPPEGSEAVAAAYNELREALDLPLLVEDDSDGSKEEE